MEAIIYRKECKEGDKNYFLLASDMHTDDAGFDSAKWYSDANDAVSRHARIYLNGDILGLILPTDKKRYTRGRDIGNTDDKIGEAVAYAEKVLLPYVDFIDVIGCGNHETAVTKYHNIDATRLLIGFLNRSRSKTLPAIRHGGYTGFIRNVLYRKGDANKHAYDIFYNHGQGGSSPVTKGTIDLSRRTNIRADLIWLGHKHVNISEFMDSEIGLSHAGEVYEKEKRGIITGTYLKNAEQTNASEDGYTLSYQEEKCRTPQGRGSALLELTYYGDRIVSKVTT